MIKTPVCYDERFSTISYSDGDVIAYDIHQDVAEEVVKRINMHDELVELLKESKYAISETYGIDSVFVDRVNNALERCK